MVATLPLVLVHCWLRFAVERSGRHSVAARKWAEERIAAAAGFVVVEEVEERSRSGCW